jgi:hypothetical protein
MVKLLIAGSRTLIDLNQVHDYINQGVRQLQLSTQDIQFVLSGMAPGADRLAISWAKQNGISVLEYPAQWDDLTVPGAEIAYRYGRPYNRKAGFQRNERMAQEATHAVILIRNDSAGSKHMLSLVKFSIPTVNFNIP